MYHFSENPYHIHILNINTGHVNRYRNHWKSCIHPMAYGLTGYFPHMPVQLCNIAILFKKGNEFTRRNHFPIGSYPPYKGLCSHDSSIHNLAFWLEINRKLVIGHSPLNARHQIDSGGQIPGHTLAEPINIRIGVNIALANGHDGIIVHINGISGISISIFIAAPYRTEQRIRHISAYNQFNALDKSINQISIFLKKYRKIVIAHVSGDHIMVMTQLLEIFAQLCQQSISLITSVPFVEILKVQYIYRHHGATNRIALYLFCYKIPIRAHQR